MKEMVGGCCVCSDERGWPDNPLVYCDGNGCTVAVHQACYGIVTVPTGPWFCRKCESPERQAKVRCELCPSRSGALKRADTGGWAHVVCALYIPEVRFGNVTSMEPIILQLIPQERFNKTCYICQDLGKVSRANIGACMQCNKPGCKQQFHVTCAQGLGLLCEEAGNYLDNVKYCGYCQHHYSKLKKGGNVKTIPPYKPISADSQSSDSSPEKDGNASPPSTSNIVPSGTSSSSVKGSTSKMQNASRKTAGYQSASGKSAQSNIKTPTSATSPSFGSPQLQSSNTKNNAISQGANPSLLKASSTDTLSSIPVPSSSINTTVSSISNVNTTLQVSPQVQGSVQKFTSSNFTESVITNGDSVFGTGGSEQKQTKKRKAITQATAAGIYPSTSVTVVPQVSDAASASVSSWEAASQPAIESTPDSTNDEKIKKVKTDMPMAGQSGPSSTSQAEIPTASISTAHYASAIQATPSTSGITASNIQQTLSHDRTIMTTSNIHFGNNQSSVQSQSIPSTSHLQVPTKYSPSVGSDHVSTRQDTPTSLLVSVPLNQGLNLTQQHLTSTDLIPPPRTLPPTHSPQVVSASASGTISSSTWGAPAMQHPNISEMPSTSGEKHGSIDKAPASVLSASGTSSSGIIRNKKRAAVNQPPILLHSPNADSIQAANVKRKTDPTSLPQLFNESKSVVDSPPNSPGSEIKANLKFSKLEKAAHMLGNELNPDSAAAARLSEQLSAELAAHSVFHATPAPLLVPPPLINKATNSSGSRSSSVLSSCSGAQSLDQLLERQWEQGSQFLMEQAQHFDIASLLSCLHQLRTENVRLEEHVSNLLQRRDHLLAVNARLAIPLNTVVAGGVESRAGRENGSNVRSSPVIRADTSIVTERPQQLTVRELPQKPS